MSAMSERRSYFDQKIRRFWYEIVPNIQKISRASRKIHFSNLLFSCFHDFMSLEYFYTIENSTTTIIREILLVSIKQYILVSAGMSAAHFWDERERERRSHGKM